MNLKTYFSRIGLCLGLCLLGLASAQADCISPAPGLIGWWRAENDGADHVSTNTASLVDGAAFADGFVGRAFAFDGLNDLTYVPAPPFTAVSNNFTMEMWVFPTADRGEVEETVSSQTGIGTGQRYAVFPSHGDGSFGEGHAGVGLSIGTNGLTVFEHAAFYIPSPLVFHAPLVGWNHVAVVYASNRPSLYLNGVLVKTGLASPRLVHPSAQLGGGAYGYFAGLLDEYAIYDRALSAPEIQAIFMAGAAGRCVPPMLNIASLPDAVRLTWTTNASNYLLETNGVLSIPVGWGVLASNYAVLNNHHAVTNPLASGARFFRLRKP